MRELIEIVVLAVIFVSVMNRLGGAKHLIGNKIAQTIGRIKSPTL